MAHAEYIAVWLVAADRPAVERTVASINEQLTDDPKGNGAHLSEGLWRIDRSLLRAYYSIDDANGTVLVEKVTRA